MIIPQKILEMARLRLPIHPITNYPAFPFRFGSALVPVGGENFLFPRLPRAASLSSLHQQRTLGHYLKGLYTGRRHRPNLPRGTNEAGKAALPGCLAGHGMAGHGMAWHGMAWRDGNVGSHRTPPPSRLLSKRSDGKTMFASAHPFGNGRRPDQQGLLILSSRASRDWSSCLGYRNTKLPSPSRLAQSHSTKSKCLFLKSFRASTPSAHPCSTPTRSKRGHSCWGPGSAYRSHGAERWRWELRFHCSCRLPRLTRIQIPLRPRDICRQPMRVPTALLAMRQAGGPRRGKWKASRIDAPERVHHCPPQLQLGGTASSRYPDVDKWTPSMTISQP